jgi:CRISPR-associated exonuclease Cas4
MGWLMDVVILTAVAAAFLGVILLLVARRYRAGRGLGDGESIALDNVTLSSERLKLVGRPDRIVRQGNRYIPEEWKSSKRVSHGHRLQLGAYFLLIEEAYGVRPPFGVVVLGDGSRVEVPNTDALRAEVLAVAAKIREHRAKLADPIPMEQPATKCRACGQRANCGQRSG